MIASVTVSRRAIPRSVVGSPEATKGFVPLRMYHHAALAIRGQAKETTGASLRFLYG